MDRELLFLSTVDDLANRLAPGADEYTLLRSAGLLRQLLTDERALAPAIASRHKVKLSFVVNATPPPWEIVPGLPPFQFWSLNDGLTPTGAASPRPAQVDLAGLLGTRVMVVNGHDVTVKDIIRYVAHVEGAVHAGVPKGDVERALAEVSSDLEVAGYSATVAAVRGIGEVVLSGLQPLRSPLSDHR
jgi:hypothetical protein